MLKFIRRCTNAIKAKYESIQRANSRPFFLRIIDRELANKNIVYIVQIVGKNSVFKLCAAELFNDNKLLQGLSPFDLLKILSDSNKKSFLKKKNNLIIFPCRAQYKMIAKHYDNSSQETIFTIQVTQATNVIQKQFTALEILNNPLILEKLSYQETYDLGFTVGSEAILKEIQKLTYLK